LWRVKLRQNFLAMLERDFVLRGFNAALQQVRIDPINVLQPYSYKINFGRVLRLVGCWVPVCGSVVFGLYVCVHFGFGFWG